MDEHIGDKIKAVLLDHDDTIVDTINTKWAQHKHIAKTYYNKDLKDDEIKLHWGKPLRELVSLLYDTSDGDQALAYTELHHTEFPKKVFTYSVPIFKHLKSLGKLIGVITATNRFSFEYDIKSHGISLKHFDYTQTAEDTAFHKPDPRVFDPAKAWLKEHKVKPSEVLYIGDGLQDMKAALGAGFNFLGVETGLITAEEFASAGVKSIPTLGHLLKAG